MPEKVKFTRHHKELKTDFKSILKRVQKTVGNYDKPYINKCQEHIACSYEYKVVCIDDRFSNLNKNIEVKSQLTNSLLKCFKN